LWTCRGGDTQNEEKGTYKKESRFEDEEKSTRSGKEKRGASGVYN
jgi:hypothetical protein